MKICIFYGQTVHTGDVSFITSENIYVRFPSTENIEVMDTLYKETLPCLQVIKKSSTSCVCIVIDNCAVAVGDQMTYHPSPVATPVKEEEVKVQTPDSTLADQPINDISAETPDTVDEQVAPVFEEKFNARVSLSSNSQLSPLENKDRHRIIGRVNMNFEHIDNGKFSVEAQMNYTQQILPEAASVSVDKNLFRLYNLAVRYDVNPTMHITAGRKINRNLASIGAIDGVQFEKSFNRFLTGALIGFSPDYENFSFNSQLLEYGAFVGYFFNEGNLYSRTTLGILEQRNSGQTDRRYAHFQSVQNISRNLNLFGTMELDLFSKVNGETSNDIRLTNLYLSARYRFSRALSATVSYDSRKRIIYYETYETEVEKLLADDEARQGVRLRVNYRPINYVYVGASYSKRFQTSAANESNNINAFISFTKLPWIGGTLSLRWNNNQSNYLQSNIYSGTYSFNLFDNFLNTQLYYRNVSYDYIASETKIAQAYYGSNFYMRFHKTLRFGLLLEMSTREDDKYYRINTKLLKRF